MRYFSIRNFTIPVNTCAIAAVTCFSLANCARAPASATAAVVDSSSSQLIDNFNKLPVNTRAAYFDKIGKFTPAQWQAFLAKASAQPASIDGVKINLTNFIDKDQAQFRHLSDVWASLGKDPSKVSSSDLQGAIGWFKAPPPPLGQGLGLVDSAATGDSQKAAFCKNFAADVKPTELYNRVKAWAQQEYPGAANGYAAEMDPYYVDNAPNGPLNDISIKIAGPGEASPAVTSGTITSYSRAGGFVAPMQPDQLQPVNDVIKCYANSKAWQAVLVNGLTTTDAIDDFQWNAEH